MKQLFLQMKWVQTILQWWMNKKWRETVHYINGTGNVACAAFCRRRSKSNGKYTK